MRDFSIFMQHLIDKYKLVPHPEGGFYREVHRSAVSVNSPAIGEQRSAVTHIYFLLIEGQVSRFHKVLHDEIWNFYEGTPLRLITYYKESVDEVLIGPDADQYACIVEGGVFQAAESTGSYSFLGCTVSPGFDFKDFSFLSDYPDQCEILRKTYPSYDKFI